MVFGIFARAKNSIKNQTKIKLKLLKIEFEQLSEINELERIGREFQEVYIFLIFVEIQSILFQLKY